MPATIGQWIIKKTLSSGPTCKVKLGVHPETNEQVAIKIFNEMNKETKD